MNTILDPWDIIGWLLQGVALLAVVAGALILIVICQQYLLIQYLRRRDLRREAGKKGLFFGKGAERSETDERSEPGG
jgi:hypothetical protein